MNITLRSVFSKPDEMEAAISYEATRITWIIVNTIFTLFALWSFVYEKNNLIPLLTLLAAEAIYFTVKSFLSWKITRGGKDIEQS